MTNCLLSASILLKALDFAVDIQELHQCKQQEQQEQPKEPSKRKERSKRKEQSKRKERPKRKDKQIKSLPEYLAQPVLNNIIAKLNKYGQGK